MPKSPLRGGKLLLNQPVHMVQVIDDTMVMQPFAKSLLEQFIFEVFAPERAESHSRLVQTAIQIQHTHKAWPLTGPIRYGQDGAAVARQASKNVIAVLPDSFCNNQRCVWVDMSKNVHAHPLVIDESMPELRIEGMCSAQSKPFGFEGFCQLRFHLRLCGPTHLICRLPQVSACNQQHLFGRYGSRFFYFWNDIRCHDLAPSLSFRLQRTGAVISFCSNAQKRTYASSQRLHR